jgi:Cysteine rich repeat
MQNSLPTGPSLSGGGGRYEALPSRLRTELIYHKEMHVPSLHKLLLVPTIAVALGIFLVLLAIFHLPAFAQGRVCADDVAKFCKGLKGGQAQLRQCLNEHQSELSSQCQARVQSMEKRMQEMSDACDSDVQQFCKDLRTGGGRLAQCLKQHESELSSTCKAELAQAHPHRRSKQ